MRFLFVDRITALEKGGVTKGIKHITADDPFIFTSNIPPCFAPALVGETLGQLAAWNAMFTLDFTKRPVAGIAQSAIVHRPVHVGETLALTATIDRLDQIAIEYHAEAEVDGEVVFTLQGALGPLLPMEDFIEEEVVRTQFAQIYRPEEVTLPLTYPVIEEQLDLSDASRWFTFDKIVMVEPDRKIEAEKHITLAAPYFADHFPKKPVLPLTVLLESASHLTLTLLEHSGITDFSLYQMKRIKMKDFVQPGDIIRTVVEYKEKTPEAISFLSHTFLREKRICSMELIFHPVKP